MLFFNFAFNPCFFQFFIFWNHSFMVNFSLPKFFTMQYWSYAIDYNLFFIKSFILVPKIASALSKSRFSVNSIISGFWYFYRSICTLDLFFSFSCWLLVFPTFNLLILALSNDAKHIYIYFFNSCTCREWSTCWLSSSFYFKDLIQRLPNLTCQKP